MVMAKKESNIFPFILGLFGVGLAIGVVRGSVSSPGLQFGSGANDGVDPTFFSRYYNTSNVTASATAQRLNIDNSADSDTLSNARILAQMVLDPLARELGFAPNIISWYRNSELNQAVGGANGSDHLEALAADLDEQNNEDILRGILEAGIPFKQLILYNSIESPSFIHISYDPSKSANNQEQQILLKKNGSYSIVSLSQLQNIVIS
jgi:zinc D-Ala-D-Ala carboxypeptidase